MDCWASLENELKYKKNIENQEVEHLEAMELVFQWHLQ